MPPHFRKQIPYTTISSWRKTDYTKYIGSEFRFLFTEAQQSAEINKKLTAANKILIAISKAWVKLHPLLIPIIKKESANHSFRKNVLESIVLLKKNTGFAPALKIFGISFKQYKSWILESQFNCEDSFTSLCAKRRPHQLQIKEINTIKKMLTDTEFDHWPIVSIAGLALRQKKVVASLASWYKYANLFSVKKKLIKKEIKRIGIVSTYANEYLHVDTTYYPLLNGQNICIAFVMDNYSRMILGFEVAEKISFELVKRALSKALIVIKKHPEQTHSFLVTDGGSENHNQYMDKFIFNLSEHRITKIRALKDIKFSNSPVESINRTIKGRYLRNQKFETIETLYSYLDWTVMDYNVLRPHYKHRPRTPVEVYFKMPLNFDERTRVKRAIRMRVNKNRCSVCKNCTDFDKMGKCDNLRPPYDVP